MRSIQRAEGVSCEALFLRVSGFGISLALFWLRYIQQMTVLLVQTTVNMLLKSAVAFFFFSPFLFGKAEMFSTFSTWHTEHQKYVLSPHTAGNAQKHVLTIENNKEKKEANTVKTGP